MKYVLLLAVVLVFRTYALAQVPAEFRQREKFSDDVVVIEKDGFLGLYDVASHEPLVYPKYDRIDPRGTLHEQWTLVGLKGKLGFIDESGSEVVPVQYEDIRPFNEYHSGWAMVTFGGKLGFIEDITGTEMVTPGYDEIKPYGEYYETWALVRQGKHVGFIDSEGNEVIHCVYESIQPFGDIHPEWALAKKKGKFGFVDIAGDEPVSFIYDSIEVDDGATYKAVLNGTTIYLDVNGDQFFPED
jgi:hypothetical protein